MGRVLVVVEAIGREPNGSLDQVEQTLALAAKERDRLGFRRFHLETSHYAASSAGTARAGEVVGPGSRPLRGQPSKEFGMADQESEQKTDKEYKPIPIMQRILDDPFLLLTFGLVVPTVFYILWGVMEVVTIPLAK